MKVVVKENCETEALKSLSWFPFPPSNPSFVIISLINMKEFQIVQKYLGHPVYSEDNNKTIFKILFH